MRRITPLFLFASLTLVAAEADYYDVQLKIDASRRYIINAQIATGGAAQDYNFALTTSTPYLTVAGVGCSTCGDVNSYNQQDSTTYQPLGNSAGVNLIGNASTSGPLIKEDCALHTKNGSNWEYPNQTMIMSNRSASVYGDQISGLFGLASGRATNTLNVSVIGGIFGRDPTTESFVYALALEPPGAGSADNAGLLHWLATDSDAYKGDITWMATTASSGSDLSTFEIDGWQFKTGGTTVSSGNQNLDSTVDPYYVNIFFPSQEAQRIHAAIEGSSSGPANNGQSTIYTIPCDSKLLLSVDIGGQTWEIDQKILVEKQGDGTCVSNIQGWADTNITQYLFGSSFLSSVYVAFQIANPNGSQNDQIGFARRRSGSSLVAPVVGGVVGGVGAITIISLAIFFWIRRRNQKKVKDLPDYGNRGVDFTENKDVQSFPYATEPLSAPPTNPAILPYTSAFQPPVTPGTPQSPNINNHFSPPSYGPTYLAGASDPSQQPNPFPGHARKN